MSDKTTNAQAREGRIQVPGGRVWYRIAAPDRPAAPLLALHGGPGVPHDYLEMLEALGTERPVIFYDQLGCGNSDKPEDTTLWTVERFVEELSLVREALCPGPLHILGQSWGSMLAAEYVLSKKPEGVASLILSGPCLSTKRFVEDQRRYLAQLPAKYQEIILRAESEGVYDSEEYQKAMTYYYKLHVCRLDPWPDAMNRSMEKFGHQVYNHMWGYSEFTMTGTLRDYDQTARLGGIRVPVLFTCGRYDEATPETTGYYQSLVPGSELAVFEDASHVHHLEKPDEFLAVVRSFLARHEAAAG